MQTAVSSSALIQAFRLTLTVNGLRPHTIQNYVRVTERFAAYLDGRPLRSISSMDVRRYIATLQTRYATKTVHEAQLALRQFFRFLAVEGEIRRDPTTGIKLVRYRVGPQPTYTETEVKQLLAACDLRSREGLRNRALVAVLFDLTRA